MRSPGNRVFDHYARFYDLLNRDKDYAGEAAYVLGLMEKHGARPAAMLDLGCGTGAHALEFAAAGIDVVGVDQSAGMLEAAAARVDKVDAEIASRLDFHEADIRQLDLDRRFPAVTALFHVMSYQVSDQDQQQAMSAVARHLEPGGLFVFDCWFGPAVRRDPPVVRLREVSDELISARRIAFPTEYPDQNRVDVEFVIEITDRESGQVSESREVHRMRYLFRAGMEQSLKLAGMEMLAAYRWLSLGPADEGHWYACVVARLR